MISHFGRLWIWASVAAALLAACSSTETSSTTTASTSPIIAAREQLRMNIYQCTVANGYDPDKVTGVSENELAPHELQWRQCAYDAVRKYTQANPPMAMAYNNLIAEDISMTTAIQQGTMTRTQRRTQIEALLDQIHDAENQQIQETAAAQDQQMQQVRNIVQDMRGFAR